MSIKVRISGAPVVENHRVKVSFVNDVTLNQTLMEFDMTLGLKIVSNVRFYRPNFSTYFRCFCFPNGEHKKTKSFKSHCFLDHPKQQRSIWSRSNFLTITMQQPVFHLFFFVVVVVCCCWCGGTFVCMKIPFNRLITITKITESFAKRPKFDFLDIFSSFVLVMPKFVGLDSSLRDSIFGALKNFG